jgi:zinc finger MYM-type protein 2/3/4
LRKKLPSDPLEFELLLYAEKLAREEGIPGFEDSSDGESEPEPEPMDISSSSIPTIKPKIKSNHKEYQSNNNSESEKDVAQIIQQQQLQVQPADQEGSFKWFFGVKVFNTWLTAKIDQLKLSLPSSNKNLVLLSQTNRLPNDLVKLKNDELNYLLTDFIQEVRKPAGELYAPESLYYLCLGIQHYLQDKGRLENIFLDFNLFDNFQAALNDIALKYQIRINSEGLIISRIEEEILWESKQLGAYSPFVLLNTILFFNTKYFFLDKKESHMQLSFTNVKKHAKRNIGPNGEDYGKTVFLRYYPDFHGLEQVIYEQGENYDNPLRCPVELYNFYLSKWYVF